MNFKKLKPIGSSFEELGPINTIAFVISFIFIFFFENEKQSLQPISTRWIIVGIFSYAIFAVYFTWFFTYILPRHYKKQAILFYFQRRSMDISISISFILMDLITKSKSGDANQRDRSDEELIEICSKIDPFQEFKSHFERHDSYSDFYEYYSFIANSINQTIEKVLFFSDVLTNNQIETLLQLEKDTNSAMTKNIKFSAGTINGKPAPASIPDAYAYSINRLRKNSKVLLESFEMDSSIT